MPSLAEHSDLPDDVKQAIVDGRHSMPFSVLGQHAIGGTEDTVVRSFQPSAERVELLCEDGRTLEMPRCHAHGLFCVGVEQGAGRYRLKLYRDGSNWELIDPYAMGSAIGELDRHLFNEGTHHELYRILGSHLTQLQGVTGVHFGVWAPNASRVSVVGDFNQWDGRVHVMRSHPGSGIWDIFIPDIGEGALYKYEIADANGQLLPLKHDPFAPYFEQPPGNAAIVHCSHYAWQDAEWLEQRKSLDPLASPVSIYEVHAGSWRRNLHGDMLSYRELADTLIPYVVACGFTHIELLPITEHPFSGSWGYQPIGLYAPTSRFGSPDDFRYFVDRCHQAGIGVIMDWVPAHFPTDEHGLGRFDGTHLYEHADPRQGMHQDWNTLIYNYGRREVANYLISNAVYWVREFHLDGLRVDAVASMLYLDYSRKEGEWIPNAFGGRENLEAIAFLKRMNEIVHAEGAMTLAEESTSFPQVSHPTYTGGLGFTFKWNMGWMHDILEYMAKDPAHRKYHQNSLTFGLLYAFSENFLLPFSHDEVVHGKGSMIGKMPGDDWQKCANLRALYALMYTYPGKKLLFMGCEIAQHHEWQHDGSVHWHLLEQAAHDGVRQCVADLNRLYREEPALHRGDCDAAGFEWIACDDSEQSVIAYYRHAPGHDAAVVVCNFTPVPRHGYRIGVNQAGHWRELFNSDATQYGGSGVGNQGDTLAEPSSEHGRAASLALTLPPLSTIVLKYDGTAG